MWKNCRVRQLEDLVRIAYRNHEVDFGVGLIRVLRDALEMGSCVRSTRHRVRRNSVFWRHFLNYSEGNLLGIQFGVIAGVVLFNINVFCLILAVNVEHCVVLSQT